MSRLVNTWRIDKNDLSIGTCDDALDPESRSLWFVGNRSDLFTDEAIEKR